MNELLKSLNDPQLDSVITTDVPLRIIAGAGSGKTRVITTKIAYLIEKENLNPYKILAVTFTNKAANEMKERVRKITQDNFRTPYIMTFHSFCVRVLREDFEYVGLPKEFTIIDTSDQTKIVRKILKDLDMNDSKSKPEKKILAKISNWKSSFTTWQEAYDESLNHLYKSYAKVYRKYNEFLEEKGYVDFDDLILKVHTLFKTNIEIRSKWANRFDYILVDEFQDTNYTQFDLIKWLTSGRNCLTVVGDPDQTIYSWRGAKVNIILNFEKEFKNARTVMLKQNYRSTKPILDLANDLIDNNKNREKKDIFTEKHEGEKVSIKEANSKNFEAKYVSKKIKELVESKQYNYSDIFVLYRTNAWSFEFEKEFANNKVPFQMVGGFQFRDRKVIKDTTALLRAIVVKDDLSFDRIFGFIPKVGAVTSEKLFNLAHENNLNMFDLLVNHLDLVKTITKNLNDLSYALSYAAKMFEENKNLIDICQTLIKTTGYQDRLDLKDKEDVESLQNLEAYYDQMKQFDLDYDSEPQTLKRLVKFLQEESLGDAEQEIQVPNKVTLLTIHAAKGLENKIVFITGVNKDVFPSRMSFSSIESLEEERRAFYVAITRAQELLYISYVSGEYSYISGGSLSPSKFIGELDPNLYEIEKNIFFHSPTEMSSQKYDSGVIHTKPEKLDAGVKVGDAIEHMMFGEGIVTKVLDKFISVSFKKAAYGTKTLPINTTAWTKKDY
ncbi:ATP-dependent helicase [Spiroplasma culicicola]|uniref:DNA 3'-5' helicase n=1 Tax=Spiroplasma culicicola AES-1 TaxID=1276246 RepID=W6AFI9_9MOLU|nr:UvrD-helicase domain-containing protein [Spiroplasma culicicola]AHI52454.1 ATP-dependent DNA helicase [Spiroplasma culicicola AES-1]